MPDTAPLLQALNLTLDGSGNGTVRFGPVPGFQQWDISLYAVTAGGPNTKQALVKVYRNLVNDANLIDGTYSGNFDTSSQNPPISLVVGESLYFVFSGGNPSVAASVRIEGIAKSIDTLGAQ